MAQSVQYERRWYSTRKTGILDQKLATAEVEAALARLTNEDSKLGERLINAAVAGAVVARQPADPMLRAEAAAAWELD